MSHEFVTLEELDITLKAYAKASDVDSRIRETDAALKMFIDRTIQIAHRELLGKVGTDLNSAKTESQKNLTTQISAAQEVIAREIESRIISLKEGVSQYLLTQALQKVDQKSTELRSEYLSGFAKTRETVESLLKTHRDDHCADIDSVLCTARESSKRIAEEISKSSIESLQTQTISAVKNAMSEIVELQRKKFDEFKTVLELELSQKVIEKAQIERKIQDIEVELQAKTRAVIEFQLEQARAMMEQTARSEMRDGVQASLATLLAK
jgi:hypothetical protein